MEFNTNLLTSLFYELHFLTFHDIVFEKHTSKHVRSSCHFIISLVRQLVVVKLLLQYFILKSYQPGYLNKICLLLIEKRHHKIKTNYLKFLRLFKIYIYTITLLVYARILFIL